MREFCIGTSAITVEGGLLDCDYIVMVDACGGDIFCESYGMKIFLKQRDEMACVRDLTVNAERILALGNLLCRNTVTPCGLMDVVEDWI